MSFRRGVSDDDPWLTVKLWLFGAGAIAALIGMLLEKGWVMALGGLILAAGIAIRFVPRGGGDENGGSNDRSHEEGDGR